MLRSQTTATSSSRRRQSKQANGAEIFLFLTNSGFLYIILSGFNRPRTITFMMSRITQFTHKERTVHHSCRNLTYNIPSPKMQKLNHENSDVTHISLTIFFSFSFFIFFLILFFSVFLCTSISISPKKNYLFFCFFGTNWIFIPHPSRGG